MILLSKLLKYRIIALMFGMIIQTTVTATTVDELLLAYQAKGAESFNAARGEKLWNNILTNVKTGQPRGCTSCHSRDLRAKGKHARTGKSIEAMAPSVNSKRLTDRKKIKKWFLRNCKWAWGRECTAQEKGDFLTFIRNR